MTFSDGTSVLRISDQHLSRMTAALVQDRISTGSGTSFFQRGDRMKPMFGDMEFEVKKFARLYRDDFERLERALPHDLLFLHLYAKENGFDKIILSEQEDTDPNLPVYLGNDIADIGDILRDQEVKISERKPRQAPEGDRIMGVSPRQIREGKINLSLPRESPEPEMI